MRTILSRAASASLVLMVAACGTTQAVKIATPPTAEQALVYLIRHDYPPYIHPLRISNDGSLIATLRHNDYVAVNLPIGQNSIAIDVTDGEDFAFDLPIDRPDVRYIVLNGNIESTGTTATAAGVQVHMRTHLRAYAVAQAEAESIVAGFGKRLDSPPEPSIE